jgi:hypothetical protein
MNRAVVVLLVVFLVAFPKGGLKVGEIPVTFGYVLLGLVTVYAAVFNLAHGRYRALARRSMLALWSTIPLQGVTLLLVLGLPSAYPAYTFSFVVGFVVLPYTFLLVLEPQMGAIDLEHLQVWLRRCISFAAVYGICLFVYVLIRKKFFYVPYLTINAGDVRGFASGDPSKDIYRGGGIFKLISTYNDGNIYGVAVLMLLPLYDLAQRSTTWRLIVRASILMTLSRTAWVGLFAYELIAAVYLRPLRRLTLLYILALLAVAVAGVLYLLSFMHHGLGFLFDPTLGGRTEELQHITPQFAPGGAILFPSEIIYANVLAGLGILGLVCFLIAMFAPVTLVMMGPRRNDYRVRALVLGMGMLLICGCSDGPILLIPIMAFYWALASLAVCASNGPLAGGVLEGNARPVPLLPASPMSPERPA